ncbi:MAG: type II secretion system protein [Thermoanaerobaculia bacterium]
MVRRRGEAGYTLVILAVTTAVIGILLAAALPVWTTAVKREKEAELHFRGMQYAEAIRVYQARFNALPTSLEQLIERKPRSIRQLWKDPMTQDGKWEMVRATPGRQIRQPPGSRPRDGEQTPPEEERERPGGARQPGQEVGPIRGVRSRSEETSLLLFEDQDTYDAWEFIVDLVPRAETRPETGVLTRANSEWVGRGFPEGLEPQQGGGPGDTRQPDNQKPGVRQPRV